MKFIPHDYQKYAISFIEEHPEALLFLDLGLGKTIISLMAIQHLMYDSFEVSRVLVIAPLRVARDTWPSEIQKWDEVNGLRASVMVGTSKERSRAMNADADIYIINRENLKWLVDYLERHKIPWPFDMVVIDELSSFKNWKSQRFKALRRVRPFIKRIIGLTGTPASNGLMDLWAEVGSIDRGKRLGRFIGRYREAFFTPASMNPYTGVVYSYVLRPGADKEIYRHISDITISMAAKDYLHMPEAINVRHDVEMDEREQQVYDELKKELVANVDGQEITAANAAVLSGKLLQMATGTDRVLVPARSRENHGIPEGGRISAKRSENIRGFCRLECRKNPGSTDLSGICRSWSEPSGWRPYPDLVFAGLVAGVVSADKRAAEPPGTEKCGDDSSYCMQGHD